MLEKVTDKNLLSKAIFKHIKKDVFTNCFLSSREFDEEIESGTLYVIEYQSNNLYLLKDRGEFITLYFYLNEKNAIGAEIDDIKAKLGCKKIVLEIAHKEGQTITELFEQIGFKTVLNRVCLERDKDNIADEGKPSKIKVKESFINEDTENIIKFLQENFDRYTGCIPNINTIKNRVLNNEIYVLEDEASNIIGLLEFNLDKKTTIKHLAIAEKYRGHGLAKYLISLLSLNQNKTIITWTTINSDAERLYRNIGFVDTTYKSTVLIYEGE